MSVNFVNDGDISTTFEMTDGVPPANDTHAPNSSSEEELEKERNRLVA
eukprot:gene32934-42004_t